MILEISFTDFPGFVRLVAASYNTYGPVLREVFPGEVTSFELLTPELLSEPDPSMTGTLYLESPVEFGVKELFMPRGEVILEYGEGGPLPPAFLKGEPHRKVIFGLRYCDLAAIRKHDIALTSGEGDPYFSFRREGTVLVGYHQKDCGDRWCYCNSVDADFSESIPHNPMCDILVYKREDKYLLETFTGEGEDLISEFADLFTPTDITLTEDDRRVENTLTFTPPLDTMSLEGLYDSPLWDDLVSKCLSCGMCNTLCPTCYCFEFKDIEEGGTLKRVRNLSECHFDCFTGVAGGHTFRYKKGAKFKHRILHQLEYFKEREGETLCTGCGRCIRYCPTKIDFVTGINGGVEAEVKSRGGEL